MVAPLLGREEGGERIELVRGRMRRRLYVVAIERKTHESRNYHTFIVRWGGAGNEICITYWDGTRNTKKIFYIQVSSFGLLDRAQWLTPTAVNIVK